jgi:hypothetical protein
MTHSIMEKENRKTNLVSWQLSRLKDVRSFLCVFRYITSPLHLFFTHVTRSLSRRESRSEYSFV